MSLTDERIWKMALEAGMKAEMWMTNPPKFAGLWTEKEALYAFARAIEREVRGAAEPTGEQVNAAVRAWIQAGKRGITDMQVAMRCALLAASPPPADSDVRDALVEALREIAFMGLDRASAAGPADEQWYRSRAHICIGIAARALAAMTPTPAGDG